MSTTTITSDSYGYGSIVTGTLDRPERPRKAVAWLDRPAVQTRFDWTDADFEAALGLPEPIKFPSASKQPQLRPWRFTWVWSDAALDTWEATVREHLALLERLVGK